MKTIFIVDDNDTNLTMASATLRKQYHAMTLPSAAKMFELLEKITPDLILLDIEMPEMDGFEALRQLRTMEKFNDIPVMFLTAYTDSEIEAKGFELGAVDFITKPFTEPVLLNRIKTHLDIEAIIHERTDQLNKLQNAIVSVLADVVENRDMRASGHIERTSEYLKVLIDEMNSRGLYTGEMKDWDIDRMIASARMHDLGKISITDIVVNKPGKLNDEEYEKIKIHALEGERIIDDIIALTGEGEFLNNAKIFAGNHHERWDGTGYPRGLKWTEIPLQGRIMAIVDVYDAIVSVRPYKNAFSHEEAVEQIKKASGTQFDPEIVKIFVDINEKMKEIRESL
ncbi:MAG: response regulator [Treponema sp.]|jgi:putative two-component system response regulator|nr:response regulator [Treponema sp.]